MPTEEEIKEKLTKCYKKRKPVLFYGEGHIERLGLIQRIHTERGVLDPVEFIKTKEGPTREIFIKEIGEQLDRALIDEYNKGKVKGVYNQMDLEEYKDMPGDTLALMQNGILQVELSAILRGWQMGCKNKTVLKIKNKVREHFKSTDKTYLEIDCYSDKGKDVYNFLVQKALLAYIPILRLPNSRDTAFKVSIYESPLLGFKGTLFLDNLHCDPCNEEDKTYYRSLGNIIKKRKMEPEDNLLQHVNPINKSEYNVSVNWLVAYTQDLNDFPEPLKEYFIDQFEPISLKGKKTGVEPVKERIKTEDRQQEEKVNLAHEPNVEKKTGVYNWSIHNKREIFCNGQLIAKLPNLQFKLFESLYKKSGKYVKNKTLDKCWGDEPPKYKGTLPTTMSKLNAMLEKGLEQNHIKIKSRVIEPKQENKKNVSYKLVT